MKLTVLCLCWSLLPALVRAETCDAAPPRIRLQPAGPCEEGEEDTCLYEMVLPPLTLWLPREFGELGWMSGELRRLKEEVRHLRECCGEDSRGSGEEQHHHWSQEPRVLTTGDRGRAGREDKRRAGGGEGGGHAAEAAADPMEDSREDMHGPGGTVTQGTISMGSSPLMPHGYTSNLFTEEEMDSVKTALDLSQSTAIGGKGESETRGPPRLGDPNVEKKSGPAEKKTAADMTSTTARSRTNEPPGPQVIKVSELTPQQMDTMDKIKSAHATTDQSKTPEELNPVTNIKGLSISSKYESASHKNMSSVTGDVLIKTDTKPGVTQSVEDSSSDTPPLSPPTEHDAEVSNMDGDKSKGQDNVKKTETRSREDDLTVDSPRSLNDSSVKKAPQKPSVRTPDRSDTQSRVMEPPTPADVKDPKPKKQQVKPNTGVKTSTHLTSNVAKSPEKETRSTTPVGDKVANTTINQITANVSSLKPSGGERTNPATMDRGKNTKTKNFPPNNKQVGVGKSAKPVNKNKETVGLAPTGKLKNPPPSERGASEKNITPKKSNTPTEKRAGFHLGLESNSNTSMVSGSGLNESIDTSGGLKSTQAPINNNKHVEESIKRVEVGLKTAVDKLSPRHLPERNSQSPVRNMPTPASVPDVSVVKTNDPGPGTDVKSQTPSHHGTENRTEEEILTIKSNASSTHKPNNTTALKKLLSSHLNKNQTKERQVAIKKKEPSEKGPAERNIKPKDFGKPSEKKVDFHSDLISSASKSVVSGSGFRESTDTTRGGLKSTQAPLNSNKDVGERKGSIVNPSVNGSHTNDNEKSVMETRNKTWTPNQKAHIPGTMRSSAEEKGHILDGNEKFTQLPDINTAGTQQMGSNVSGKQINLVDGGKAMSGASHKDISSDTDDIKTIADDKKQTPSVNRERESDVLQGISKPLDQTLHNSSKQLVNNNTINLNQTNRENYHTEDRHEEIPDSQLKPHKSVGTGHGTKKVDPDAKLANEDSQMDPDSPGNNKPGITPRESKPTRVTPALNVPQSVTQPLPLKKEHNEDNAEGTSSPKSHHKQGRDGEEALSASTVNISGGEQPTSPSVDRGKNDSHPLIPRQPWKTKSKNPPGVNQLKAKGQKDSIKRVEEGLKTAVDELSTDHFSERNIHSPVRNTTTPASVPDVSVVKTNDPGPGTDVRSQTPSYYHPENRTDERIFTSIKSNTSITHKPNNSSALKKLLPFHLNKNQTKERQVVIKKKELIKEPIKKKKADPIPTLAKGIKKGESPPQQGRKNNSQQMNLNPPEYGGVAKYTDEVRGSKSLTVEGIQENHPVLPDPNGNNAAAKPAQDCSDYTASGEKRKTGIFILRPDLRNSSFPVLCEMEAYDGGWTLLQRRYDGSVSFNRSWDDYKKGFGRLDGEFWLGNDMIHLLTHSKEMVLRIQLEDFEGLEAYATYEHFSVASEHEHYRLTVGEYSGTAGDALHFSQRFDHNQKLFTTPDRDNDQYSSGNCGAYYGSGWWFDSCMSANLNGKYYNTWYKGVRNGIYWGAWPNISREYYPTNYRHAFKTVSMMIRPSDYKP